MTRFLIATIAAAGHVNPALPIARKLIERGHEVWWYTGKGFKEKIEATGAHHVPIRTGIDLTDINTIPQAWIKQKEALKGLSQFKFYLKHGFIDSAITQLKDLTNILDEFPADVLLCDVFCLGISWLHEKTGLPWAAFGMSALPFNSRDTAPFRLGISPGNSWGEKLRNRFLNYLSQNILMRDVTLHLDQRRESVGLPKKSQDFFTATLSQFLYLQGTTPSFEYPRSDLAPQIHFIGTFLPPAPAFTPPAWWDDLKLDKPIIHVTQGTVATEAKNLILPTIEALANEDVLLIVTTGGQPIENLQLNPIPQNVRLEKFISHAYLLPYVDVMVTNGGFNGVQTALAFGVPMVTAGQTEEKPEIGARVQWSGTGIDLKTSTPTPQQIRDAVIKILRTPKYLEKAESFKTEINRYDTPTLATELLEQLALTKNPVYTTHS
ncbi:glycosyl transferase [Dulcicalothrix desertica PCC 7102]|uniref:Glycosyl transferase n=1 Tax=Dulcicalothrix desertica PCC 7102 TaxID=232991 RepID=A0A433UW03_9CYAN|nr:glycosyltransferase [Dulcicalothrix desertica]RUS98010.1 glycosyl transferase [Dulcicalothrix desertica PCC 7102]TWH54498.1 MGT family glycosyltransferase [Dulcicalothrix desertica PCC 7102]